MLKKAKKIVTDYTTNPAKYLDLATLQEGSYFHGSSQWLRVKGKLLKTVMAESGFQLLGSGHYSDVFYLDEERVLKIVRKNDSGYARFVSLLETISNPHLPRIYLAEKWGNAQIYVIEALLAQAPSDGMFFHFRNSLALDNPFMSHTTQELLELARFLDKHNLQNDLHSDNVMWRGDIPVVTDPCSEGGTS